MNQEKTLKDKIVNLHSKLIEMSPTFEYKEYLKIYFEEKKAVNELQTILDNESIEAYFKGIGFMQDFSIAHYNCDHAIEKKGGNKSLEHAECKSCGKTWFY